MIIDCVADLHGFYPELEGGDLLIIAGDLTAHDELEQYRDFNNWVLSQEYDKIIIVCGNHDKTIEKFKGKTPFATNNNQLEYLCDSGTEYQGLKIWGSPWTKSFKGMNPKFKAFTFDTEEELVIKFSLIPEDTDILITHSPPYGILDQVKRFHYPITNTRLSKHLNNQIENVGSKSLYAWLKYVERTKLHVFGHIHEAYGREELFPTCENKMMISVNASIVNENYKHVNKPIRVNL